nr:immunoglobulin heavy chain junction region [Macaca mulatta]MOX66745.1 immunoglobulin heavy chain junction region [Macaca mulatta]MOX68145.1 immunoglobulin heavy chain junction region [Macaca mulatta]
CARMECTGGVCYFDYW